MMLAKRKVGGGGGGGRGDAVVSSASHHAFGPQEDEAIIKHRLLTRTTTTRGEPPLKKLQKKFTSFFLEIDKDDATASDCERLSRAFLQELTTFELPLLKSRAVIDANLREKDNFNHLKARINDQILLAQNEIELLKLQLHQAKIERQHKEECEAIRSLIAKQPPRSLTQNAITDLNNHIAELQAQNTAASRTLQLRKKQFALLLHLVDELQNTIEEEQKSLAEEMRTAAEEHKSGPEDASGPSDVMVLD
uniref:THO complex subunit 7 n=1 Tax=Kalanchoe fedtschenkoi TaxID=63787 RepID=A0A7N1A6L9_KALFE